MNVFWKTLGIFGSIASIVGIGLAFYFYNLTKETREPYFYDYPVKTKVIESKFLSEAPFKIFRLNGEEIKKDISSSTFYFWNQGKKPIKTADILDSLVISLSASSEILKFQILGQSRNVCQFKLFQIDKNHLKLYFNIAEQFDGCVAQLIYIGEANQKIEINGNIEGVKKFNSTSSNNVIIIRIFYSLLVGLIFMTLVLFLTVISYRHEDKNINITFLGLIHLLFSAEVRRKGNLIVWFVIIALFLLLFHISKNFLPPKVESLVPTEIRKIAEK